MSATWRVFDIHPRQISAVRFELREAFAIAHDEGVQPYERTIWDGAGYVVDAVTMDHRTPTLAYVVHEKARRNIDMSRLASLGLRPGPWLKELKEPAGSSTNIVINGTTHPMDKLRKALIVETPGDSIAYLTDFLLDEPAMERLIDPLRGCRVMICEGQYRHADVELARKNFHMTTVLSATLAQRAQVEELVLFHLSDRYERTDWGEMLREAQQVFPKAQYPPQWGLDVGARPRASADDKA
jgi:ribonuclease Z